MPSRSLFVVGWALN